MRLARVLEDFGVRPKGFEQDLDAIRTQLGALESRMLAQDAPSKLRDAEFRVFSQFGEDGIIQYLIQQVPIERDIFIEFGVEDYSESNTRFLLANDNWRGLIIDGGERHKRFLQRKHLDWRHEVTAVTAFIDRDNINRIIRCAGIDGDIGLLSIDIDGNDYWVLAAIEVVSPRILVVEYNSSFGSQAAVTVPYDPEFRRGRVHWSHLYWGASLAGLDRVARARGYVLVGGNSAGNNAFWVRRDVLGQLPEATIEDAYAPSRFRESRDQSGSLTYVANHHERLALMRDLPLWDVDAERCVTVADCFGL